MNARRDGPPVVILVGPEDKERLAAAQAGLAPQIDYCVLLERLSGGYVQEMHPTSAQMAGIKLTRLLRSQGANLQTALRLLRTLPDDAILYATGETWGLPISLAASVYHPRRPTIIWQVHQVWSKPWVLLLRMMRAFVDGWICQTTFQLSLLRKILGDRMAPAVAISPGVDTAFFQPFEPRRSCMGPMSDFATGMTFSFGSAPSLAASPSPYILAIGAASRNYPLLFQAVSGLDISLIVQASSQWMADAAVQSGRFPSNVRVQTQRISYADLRVLYAGATLVVTPVYDTPVAAGVNSILEAMSMGKAVVATRSRGLPDVLIDGVNGRIVEPDSADLAAALAVVGEGDTMSARAYDDVRSQCTIKMQATQIADFIGLVVARRYLDANDHA